MYHRYWLWLAVVLLPACLHAPTPGLAERAQPSPLPPDSSLVLGVYAACMEASMHTEVLELQADSFHHYIRTDIGPERTTSGTYRLHGDTLTFLYEIPSVRRNHLEFLIRQGRSAEEVYEENLYPWRMLIDRIHGHPVLWRTRGLRDRRKRGEPITGYSVLLYIGPEREAAERPPSCHILAEEIFTAARTPFSRG